MPLNSLATGNMAHKHLIDLTTVWHTVVERICCFPQYLAVQEKIHFHHAVAWHLVPSILQFMRSSCSFLAQIPNAKRDL